MMSVSLSRRSVPVSCAASSRNPNATCASATGRIGASYGPTISVGLHATVIGPSVICSKPCGIAGSRIGLHGSAVCCWLASKVIARGET